MNSNKSHLRAVPSTGNRSGSSQPQGHWFDKYLAPAALGMTILALGGLGVRSAVGGGSSHKPSGLSVKELKDLPSVPVTPDQDLALQGASALGQQVDPWVYRGPDSNATTAANLDAEIAGQDPSGFIHTDETFQVPVIPKPEHPTK